MALPRLAERVSLILPGAVPNVSYLEEQLASHGLTVGPLKSSVSSDFDNNVFQRITGVTTASNDYAARINVDLNGKLCLSDGQIKPTVAFSGLELIAVPLFYRGKPIVTLLTGAGSPFGFSPEGSRPDQHLRWRNYGEAGTVNFLVTPEDNSRVPPKRHVDKAYSLDEAEGLGVVDKRILAVHKVVGPRFFYLMVQRDDDEKEPRHHYLTLNPLAKGDGFKIGVDALCRIMDSHPSRINKGLRPRQAVGAV